MELKDVILKRRSIRKYEDKPVEKELLAKIVDAGCHAPVGLAQYDRLHLSVVQDKKILNQIVTIMTEQLGLKGNPLYDAPVLITVSAQEMNLVGIEVADSAFILQNMLLEATELNLGGVVIWASGKAVNCDKELMAKLGIPEGYQAVTGIVLGYPASDAPIRDIKHQISTTYVQ